MTSDAFTAPRSCEIIPEESVRDYVHTVQVDIARLNSEVERASAAADQAERALGVEAARDDVCSGFSDRLRQSLDDLIAATEQELRAARDEAHRVAESRVAEAREQVAKTRADTHETHPASEAPADAHRLALIRSPKSSIADQADSIEDRTAYLELRSIASGVLGPVGPALAEDLRASTSPETAVGVEPASAATTDEERHAPLTPEIAGEPSATASVSLEDGATVMRRRPFLAAIPAVALPFLAAVLVVVSILLLRG